MIADWLSADGVASLRYDKLGSGRTGLGPYASHPGAGTDFVPLTGADHVLKQDPTGAPANYARPLPYSPQFQRALRSFIGRNL